MLGQFLDLHPPIPQQLAGRLLCSARLCLGVGARKDDCLRATILLVSVEGPPQPLRLSLPRPTSLLTLLLPLLLPLLLLPPPLPPPPHPSLD